MNNLEVTVARNLLKIKAVFLRYIPYVFGVILCFGITMLLIYLWLN